MQSLKQSEQTLKTLVRLGLTAIGANQGALLVSDRQNRMLRFAFLVSRNILERHEEIFDRLIGKEVPFGEGVTGLAASECKPHYARTADNGNFHRISGDGAPSAVLAVPMLCHGRELCGVMTAISFDCDRGFDEAAGRLYEKYAEVAAYIVCKENVICGAVLHERDSHS